MGYVWKEELSKLPVKVSAGFIILYIYNIIIQLLHLSQLLVINCRSKPHRIRYYFWRSVKCGLEKNIFYTQRTNNSPNFKLL